MKSNIILGDNCKNKKVYFKLYFKTEINIQISAIQNRQYTGFPFYQFSKLKSLTFKTIVEKML